jgi:hypothetical protein
MSLDRPTAMGPAGEARYEIRIRGHLEDRWSASFEGFTIERQADGSTLLIGESVDQAALHGLLRQVRDLGLPLLAVAWVAPAAQGRRSEAH